MHQKLFQFNRMLSAVRCLKLPKCFYIQNIYIFLIKFHFLVKYVAVWVTESSVSSKEHLLFFKFSTWRWTWTFSVNEPSENRKHRRVLPTVSTRADEAAPASTGSGVLLHLHVPYEPRAERAEVAAARFEPTSLSGNDRDARLPKAATQNTRRVVPRPSLSTSWFSQLCVWVARLRVFIFKYWHWKISKGCFIG